MRVGQVSVGQVSAEQVSVQEMNLSMATAAFREITAIAIVSSAADRSRTGQRRNIAGSS